MRTIKYIVIHCTSTKLNATVNAILRYWREVLNWKNPGYHYLIEPDGTVHNLQPIEKVANGVSGYNSKCIHIGYVGGVDSEGKNNDTRTEQQKEAKYNLVLQLKFKFPDAEIKGHRDFPNVKKDCPCFDVKKWLKEIYDNLPYIIKINTPT